MSFLESLLSSITSNVSNIFIYIIIVALFIVGVISCVMPVLRTRGRLRFAIRNIRAGERAKQSWQENEFLGKGSLMAHWSAYLDNLFFAEGEYHNASNVEDFINEETVIYGPGRGAFAEALPGLEVSIGFLGTLIGLAQGLSGFNMQNAAAAQNSITVLIPGMRYAFMTSIFGVIGSILFTLITRAVYGSTEKTLRQFYGAMSRYAGVRSVDPLTQVAIYQQEQTALIQTMAKDLNGAFTKNITQAIADAVDPINQNLRSFMTVTSQEQMRFLDAVVMRFVDRMDDVLSGKLHEFGRVLDATNRTQQEAFNAIRAGMVESSNAVRDLRSVQRLAQEISEGMSGYLSDLRASQQEANRQANQMASAVEQMDLVTRRQADYLKSVSAMQSDISRWMETLTNSVSSFTRENAGAAQAMQKAAQELRDAGDRLQTIQKNATEALDHELQSTMDSYRDYVNQFTQRVDYLTGSIADALNELPQAVGQTSDQFLDQVDRLTQTLDQAQHALNDAVDRLYR